MDSDTEPTLMHLLSRDVLKQNLAKAGLYALAYELLKNSIIDSYLCRGSRKRKVLNQNAKVQYATPCGTVLLLTRG